MKVLWSLLLLLPLAPPAHPQDLKFDTFLVRFRLLYENYHFGPHWPQQKVDKEAARIWSGSNNYGMASTTACQGVFEVHFNADPFIYGHRGNMGMRVNTIVAEGIRTGLIKKGDKEGIDWLLKACRKDPGLADKLAGSRLVYLVKICGSEQRALRVWVRGSLNSQTSKDRIDSSNYANGVLKLRQTSFGQ